jgi:hypothetical protein
LAINAPRLYARQIAVTLQPFAVAAGCQHHCVGGV